MMYIPSLIEFATMGIFLLLVLLMAKIFSDRKRELESKNAQLQVAIKEVKLAQTRLIAQEKLASLGFLTAGIAHEIKNPLNFINNFSELSLEISNELKDLVQANYPLLPPISKEEMEELMRILQDNIAKIHEHGKRADSIVQSMLSHSRGQSNEKRIISIHDLLDESFKLAYHGLRANNDSFNVKIVKNYDTSIEEIAVIPQNINRVFLNLFNNALYSTTLKTRIFGKEYVPLVVVKTNNRGDRIQISIHDNGLGVPADKLEQLFVPFFTTKPTGEGTGLGLSISYNIIQEHSGTITANSLEGEFAEFVITLPK